MSVFWRWNDFVAKTDEMEAWQLKKA